MARKQLQIRVILNREHKEVAARKLNPKQTRCTLKEQNAQLNVIKLLCYCSFYRKKTYLLNKSLKAVAFKT